MYGVNRTTDTRMPWGMLFFTDNHRGYGCQTVSGYEKCQNIAALRRRQALTNCSAGREMIYKRQSETPVSHYTQTSLTATLGC